MSYEMRLDDEPFKSIKSGSKDIELRLNDEKRRLINIGDIIEFTNIKTQENLKTQVINLYHYNNFEELYKDFDKTRLGYRTEEIASPQDMERYYSLERQAKYGVLGIEVSLLVDGNGNIN